MTAIKDPTERHRSPGSGTAATSLRVLYVEDEPFQRALGIDCMRAAGHIVVAKENGKDALRALERDTFNLVVLDWSIPAPDGLAVLERMRARGNLTPVIFMTARDREEDIVTILEAGADDYLVKPARPQEFVARLAAIARRRDADSPRSSMILAPPYRADLEARAIYLNEKKVPLSARKAEVALFFFRWRGQLVSRRALYDSVWGREPIADTRTIDVHVSFVRKALSLDGSFGWRLQSIYQKGYRLEQFVAETA